MQIAKIMNNNCVVALDGRTEKILIGKGIAFSRKVGELVDLNKVEKEYILSDEAQAEELLSAVSHLDYNIIKVIDATITEITLELSADEKLSPTITTTLLDHISCTIERMKQGTEIVNPLIFDIQRFYPKEYGQAKRLVDQLNACLDVVLDDNEVGFVALHIVDSTINSSQNQIAYQLTVLIKDVSNIVRRYFQIDFNESSVSYYRFVTHLRLFGQRLFLHQGTYHSSDLIDMLEFVKEKYRKSYQCAWRIKTYLEERFRVAIQDEELLYLTIHIQRIIDELQEFN